MQDTCRETLPDSYGRLPERAPQKQPLVTQPIIEGQDRQTCLVENAQLSVVQSEAHDTVKWHRLSQKAHSICQFQHTEVQVWLPTVNYSNI